MLKVFYARESSLTPLHIYTYSYCNNASFSKWLRQKVCSEICNKRIKTANKLKITNFPFRIVADLLVNR